MAGTFTRIATTRRPFRDYFLPHRYEKTFILSLFCLLAQDLWAQAVLPGNVVTGYLQVRHGATASAGTHDGNLVVIGPAEIEWAFSPDGQALRLVPGWDFSKNTRFELNGDVAFSRKVTIGNVATSGPLGINNLTLAVGGKIGAQGGVYVVNQGAVWPDYVFQKAYRLRPLAEVARFIEENQHLPDVPSAQEVATNGIELASMQAVLLRKVEELTLHLIELKKANDVLQARVDKLEN